jgi:2-phospho-L-lactate guanylyltransferase
VQATVHRFDPLTGSGSVLTDEGLLIPFGQDALAGSGLRHLRTGQRLTIVLAEDPSATTGEPAAGPAPRVAAMHLGTVGSAGP